MLAVLALLVHVDGVEEGDVVASEAHGPLGMVDDTVLTHSEHIRPGQLQVTLVCASDAG